MQLKFVVLTSRTLLFFFFLKSADFQEEVSKTPRMFGIVLLFFEIWRKAIRKGVRRDFAGAHHLPVPARSVCWSHEGW